MCPSFTTDGTLSVSTTVANQGENKQAKVRGKIYFIFFSSLIFFPLTPSRCHPKAIIVAEYFA